MADRNFPSDREYNFNYNAVLVAGSFQVDAVPAIAAGTIYGNGYTAVRDAGAPIVYNITTQDAYRHVIDFGANLGLATPIVDMIANCGIPAGAPGIITMSINITPVLILAAQDPPAANDIISFWMLLSNSAQDYIR